MQTEQTKLFVWDAKLWSTLYIVSIVLFMDALDTSIVNVALPSIQQSLNLSNSDQTWVQGAYVLAYASFLLLGGRASDQLGRRRVLLAGMVVFGCASLLGGFAQVVWLLILSRIVQGIGAAFTVPAARPLFPRVRHAIRRWEYLARYLESVCLASAWDCTGESRVG